MSTVAGNATVHTGYVLVRQHGNMQMPVGTYLVILSDSGQMRSEDSKNVCAINYIATLKWHRICTVQYKLVFKSTGRLV